MSEIKMDEVSIDGVIFKLGDLSENAKQQLIMLQATDQEIQRLTLQTAMMQTARSGYAAALKAELPQTAQ